MNISQACRHVKMSRALKAISRKKDYKHTLYFVRKQYNKQETDLWNRPTALKRASKKTDLISKKAVSREQISGENAGSCKRITITNTNTFAVQLHNKIDSLQSINLGTWYLVSYKTNSVLV
jgi:hypothetical protein